MALVTGQNVADALQLTYADDTAGFDQAADAADLTVGNLLTTAALAAENAPCKEAALQVGIEIYQARTSVGGQIVSRRFHTRPVSAKCLAYPQGLRPDRSIHESRGDGGMTCLTPSQRMRG
jgi:hypothetical protein